MKLDLGNEVHKAAENYLRRIKLPVGMPVLQFVVGEH